MRGVRIFRASPVLGLVLLAMLGGVAPACAQNQHKVGVVPNTPHSVRVTSVAFSPDGARVLSGSADRTIKLWDAATGAMLRTFEGHSDEVNSVVFSPDGTRVLSGSEDKTIKLWDAATGTMLRTVEGHYGGVKSVAFSPDGARLLSGADVRLRLWDAATGALLRTFESHPGGVWSVAFSPDGARVLSGSDDNTMRLWDAATGALLRTFVGHSNSVMSVAFSPNGTSVLSGSADKTMRLWGAATGALLRTFVGHSNSVMSVAFSPSGTSVMSSSHDSTMKTWDAATGTLLRSYEGHAGHSVLSVAFSPDGARVLSGSYDNTVKLWDAPRGALLRTFQGHSAMVHSAAFSPDGVRILSGDLRTVSLWDARTGAQVRAFQIRTASVAFSPDGARVLSGSQDKTIRLWDAATGVPLRSFEAHSKTVKSVAFSPDGARVLSGSLDKTVRLWDAATGALLRTFEGHSDWVMSVAVSPDGTRMLSGSEGKTIRLWDAATGALLRTFEGHSRAVYSVAFSPDGARVLSGSQDKTIRLWDAATGALLRTFEAHTDWVMSAAFSPDGSRVVSGSYDGTIRLWDVATGAPLRTFEGHAGWVWSVAFSPDGTRVLSGGGDGTIRLWDIATGAQLGTLICGDGQWLAMTPKGFFAASSKGTEMLSIVRGFDVTTIDQVHQSLFNPDLVREALAGDPDGEVAEAAKVVNLEKVLDSGPAPSVAIASPDGGSQSAVDLVEVTARIEDRGKGVGRIEWRVNGITAAVAAKPEGRGSVYTVTRQLALDAGDNTIEAVAYNGSNLLASLPARTSVKFTGPADKTKPKLHILALGIDAYDDMGWTPPGADAPRGFGPLGLAVKDATQFADSMQKAAAGLYEEVRVTMALDKDATRDNLHRLVDKIAADIHPRDSFILFAAAHGDAEKGRFYLIPQDYQSGPPGALAQRAIGQDDLQDWLANRIKARKAIVLLDTCESGALIAGHRISRTDTPASEAAVGRLHEATGRPVLTATAAGQQAGEGVIAGSREGHGYFTWAVLDALRHGDSNGNGLIELSELAAHVQAVVPKVAAGIVVRAAASEPASARQAARFGSRGEDFAVARRLQ
jgi:WD40 repeat protein